MTKFTGQVLEYKNSFSSISQAVNETNSLFEQKYFQGAKTEIKFQPPFIPGQIYSFFYKTPSVVDRERKFINRNPLVLCIDSFQNKDSGLILKGIDLIVVPPDFRVKILERIYDNFLPMLETGITPLPLTSQTLSSLLGDTGYSASVFGFRTSYFGEIYTVDLNDWCKIPYLGKSFVEGLNLQGIYTEYKSKLI